MKCMIKAMLSCGLQFISHLSKPYLFVLVKRIGHFKQAKKTTLTEFFKLNERDQTAHDYLYHEIPEHFTFNRQKNWQRRQLYSDPIIGRLYQFQPSHPERFALRLLLLHRKQFTSFEDLRTIDGYLEIHSKMQQEQWDCLRMTLNTGSVCKKH